ncbi:MAG: DedA family protein [Spirochaetes bacterium]|nr:DedA family protein [Spirochaetota bacterium]
MENKILQLLNSLNGLPDWVFYVILFFSAILENIFPPIPGDTVTAFGAYLVSKNILSFFWVYISTTLGSGIGYFIMFFTGKKFGRDFFIKRNFRFFPASKILKAEKKFIKLKYSAVLFNRFFPGIRSAIAIVSGIINLKSLPVFFISLVSAAGWNFLWIFTGYMLGKKGNDFISSFKNIMSSYNSVAGIIIIVILTAGTAVFFIRKKIKKP